MKCHDAQEASFNVASCVMDMLETIRNGSPSKGETSKNRSKVLVSPGKGTSMENLKEREKSNRKMRSQRKQTVLKKQHQKSSFMKMKAVKMGLILKPWRENLISSCTKFGKKKFILVLGLIDQEAKSC